MRFTRGMKVNPLKSGILLIKTRFTRGTEGKLLKNGILLIITLALIGLGLILVISFAGFFMDLINQSGFDYSTISSKTFLK